MRKKNFNVLIPYYRTRSNGESEMAGKMFNRFIEEEFSYDDINSHPDYVGYASAELLIIMLPQMIDEMLKQDDTGSYLVYPMVSAIDPEENCTSEIYKERVEKLIELTDRPFAEKMCQFLEAMKQEPPNSTEQIDRLLEFWGRKANE